MTGRLSAVLAANARRTFEGREVELAELMGMFGSGEPADWFVEGIAGIGKSRLFSQFGVQARDTAIQVMQIDCRTVEPTAEAFLAAAGSQADVASSSSPAGIIDSIAARANLTLLILDAYESFQIRDSWMRAVFLPLLPEEFHVVMVSRFEPGVGWRSSPEWSGEFRRMDFGPLPEADALAMLTSRELSPEFAQRINRSSQGILWPCNWPAPLPRTALPRCGSKRKPSRR